MPERVSNRIFISYAREDRQWLERLEKQLAHYKRGGIIEPWIDTGKIEIGDRYNDEIAAAIDTSCAAVLLVSPNFQESWFIREKELPRVRRHADAGELKLYWLLVSDCPLADDLAETYHCANQSADPLDGMTDSQVNRVLANVARDLRQHVEKAKQERIAREEAEARAKAEQERIAREKVEARAKAERERIAREKAEARAKAERERIAREEAEARAKAEQERVAREKAEARAKAERERIAREEKEAHAKAERERVAREGLEHASKERPFTNTLGMKFVPVPGTDILMSVWETRVQDYAAFAAAVSGVDGSWKNVEFKGHKQGPEHPVVKVSWDDAQAFCAWLSKKEGKRYRLPTDHEWSLAVGIGEREDPKAAPKDKDMKIQGIYPWGTQWPPPKGAGNYSGEESASMFGKIEGYRDDHPFTAPVGSYTANGLGLYDLGGNVWEWCEDFFDGKSGSRVLRGASWLDYVPDDLLSSYRFGYAPVNRVSGLGFRVVVCVGER